MSQNNHRNRWKAILATVFFHVIILSLLFFLALSTPLPLPGEEGVEVNLGYSDEGMGTVQPLIPSTSPEEADQLPPEQTEAYQPPEETVSEEITEKVVTQDTEEAPISETREEDTGKKTEQEKPEEKPQQKVNERALYKGNQDSGTGSQGGSEGITGKPGDQGNPNGIPGSLNYEGQGGSGNGTSYSLGGRGALKLQEPEYKSQEQGKVVVTIWVNRDGKVIKAEAGAKGTNISDTKLWELARLAAMQSNFTADPDAPETQTGTITYNFIRRN